MNIFQSLKNTIRNQLFAKISIQFEEKFKRHTHSMNLVRFCIQCLIVIAVNICSLILYIIKYASLGTFYGTHIIIHAVQAAVMLICFALLSHINQKGYYSDNLIFQNIDIFFPMIYMILEVGLFLASPRDLGALIRLFCIPFVFSCVPIVNQIKTSIFQLLIFVVYNLIFIMIPQYQQILVYNTLPVNLWFIAFLCVNVVSFTGYSSHVNSFTHSQREIDTKRELVILNKRLDLITRQDQLTELSNRRDFKQYMDSTWHNENLMRKSITVIMVDIDFFKSYNDRYGTNAGDECLIQVTNCIKILLMTKKYMFVRYTSEVFIIQAYDVPHREMAELAEAIRKAVEDLKIDNPESSVSPYLTVSCGVATEKINNLTHYNNLVEWAEKCLTYAKKSGKNKLVSTVNNKDHYDINDNIIDINEEVSLEFDASSDYINRAINDLNADCTFEYLRSTQKLSFSKQAAETFNVPNFVAEPNAKKIADSVFFDAEERTDFINLFNTNIENRETFFTFTGRMKAKDSSQQWITTQIHCVYSDGVLQMLYGTIFNIQKVLQFNHYLHQQQLLNPITSLPNRQNMFEAFKKSIDNKHDDNDLIGYVIFFDIDNFKSINGIYSHNIGDNILIETSNILKKFAYRYGELFHYSVDQFIIITADKTRDVTEGIMDEIYHYFAVNSLRIDKLSLQINCTITAIEYNFNKFSIDDFFIDMDIAIQTAKFKNRSKVSFFTEDDRNEYLESFNFDNMLKKAVENDFQGFMLFYQPIINSCTEQCLGAEALLRWKGPDGNIISPLLTIPALERLGLMPEVEKWLFDAAALQCAEWIKLSSDENKFVHVNLSPAFITRSTLFDELSNAVRKYNLTLSNLIIEVTESAIINDVDIAIKSFGKLRDKGITIAIDDFGTGYSSLSYLRTLPIDVIKIDRSFVTHIESDEMAFKFLHSIISLAKCLDYKVCIEGVENSAQFSALNSMDVDFLQGYYYDKPLPADNFLKKYGLHHSPTISPR